MKTEVKIVVCALIVSGVFSMIALFEYLFGDVWTMGILLALIVVAFFLLSAALKKCKEISDDVDDDIEKDDMLSFLKVQGTTSTDIGWPDGLKLEKDQPATALLSWDNRQLRNEEKWLRSRVSSYIRRRDDVGFRILTDGQRDKFLAQLGAMVLYHDILMGRCVEEGVYLKKGDSDTGNGLSSSSDSSDSGDSSDDSE